jgi:hypothetical protein
MSTDRKKQMHCARQSRYIRRRKQWVQQLQIQLETLERQYDNLDLINQGLQVDVEVWRSEYNQLEREFLKQQEELFLIRDGYRPNSGVR